MSITRHYLYSLPERVTRAGIVLTGGAIYETSQVVLPRVVRHSKLYEATIAQLLRIIIEGVGDVKGVYGTNAMPVQELVLRKTAGNAVELASFLAVGWSPLWLLAAASDLAGGSKVYLRTLTTELEHAGLLAPNTDIAAFEDLLATLEGTSGVLANTVDVPPLNTAELRSSWQALQHRADELPDANGLAAIFAALQTAAQREERSVREVSAVVGLSAVRAGIQLGSIHIFDYYRKALESITQEGLLTFLRRTSSPYVTRAARHFHPQSRTYTERLLR